MVLQGHITQQRLLQILTAAEWVGVQYIGNTAVEALHHAIGFRHARFGKPVFYAKYNAQPVEFVVSAGFALTAGKQTIREFLAVVGQQLIDLDRAGLVQRL